MENKSSRPYRSKIREQQAMETKDKIAEVTDRLVKSKGYENTTIGNIAEEAGVATQTVYAIFGSKRGIILHLIKSAIKENVHRDVPTDFATETDKDVLYHLLAGEVKDRLAREYEAICSVGGFAMLYPELLELINLAETHRRKYIERRLSKIKATREVFNGDEANANLRIDLLWVLFDGHIYHGLIERMGWDMERFQNVLAQFIKFICNDIKFDDKKGESV